MCCGGAKTGRGQAPGPTDRHGAPTEGTKVRFTYVGRTSLSVVGGGTATLYRFQGAGATLDVDPLDAYGLSTIPMLRRALGA